MWRAGATLCCGAQASHCGGFFCCGARALGARASVVVWHAGLVAPWHVGSSQTRARTRVSSIGTWILNHCATRETLKPPFGCIQVWKKCFHSLLQHLQYAFKIGPRWQQVQTSTAYFAMHPKKKMQVQ